MSESYWCDKHKSYHPDYDSKCKKMSNELWSETCGSSPHGNVHCMHTDAYTTTVAKQHCCWCGQSPLEPEIPLHGPYYRGTATYTESNEWKT